MLVWRLFVVFVLVATLIGCGGTQTPTSVPTPELPYTEDLQRALLTISDLPPGWGSQPDSSNSELSALPCGEISPGVQHVEATAMFQTDSGARLSETVAAFHAGEAEKWLNAAENIAGCNHLSEGDYHGTPIAAQVSQPP